MNTLKFKCPGCGQKLEADHTLFGEESVCPSCGKQLRVPDSRLAEGIHLGDFVLKKCVGVGGMGEVWLSEQPSMQRLVALKIMRAELSGKSRFRKRFRKEITSSGKLLHPNIVTAFHAGGDNGIYYMAMEYIEGDTLEQRLASSGPLPEDKALRVSLEVARALDYAWNKNQMIHLDIKPSNIMFTAEDSIKLLDMGIARTFSEERSAADATATATSATTRKEMIAGTPSYMSPEQAENKPHIDCRSDIYALGVVLCEMLTGKPPFEAPSTVEVIAQHIFAPRPDLQASAGISESTSMLVQRMMAPDREKRFSNWRGVIDYIESYRAATKEHVPFEQPKSPRIHWLLRISAYIVLTLIIGFIAIILWLSISKQQQPKQEVSNTYMPPMPQHIDSPKPNTNTDDSSVEDDRLSRYLKLPAIQHRKVRKLLEEAWRKLQTLREQVHDGSWKDRRAHFRATQKVRRELNEKLREILTQKQFEKFKRHEQEIFSDRLPPDEGWFRRRNW